MIQRVKSGVIRVFSTMNDWIDCVFIVEEKDIKRAITVLEEAYDDFWEQDTMAYGDMLEDALNKAEIEYEAFYTDFYSRNV